MEKQKIFSKGDIVVDKVTDGWEYVLLLISDVYDDPDCEILASCYVRLDRYTGDTSVIELSLVENPWAELRYCMDMRLANEKERRTLLDAIDAYNHIIDKETLMLLPKAPQNKNVLYDDFVDSELAQTLKSKGYPQSREYAIAMYNEDGEFCSLYSSSGDYYDIGDFDENDCVAPTLQSVRKWLNEYHNIFISISVAFVGSENKKRYLWLPCVMCDDHIEYPTMEEIEADSEKDAVNAAIRYCVKYLI